MELDELKYQLKHKLATDHAGRSEADIVTLLSKKTNSVIAKLMNSLWYEIISCIVIILAFLLIVLLIKNDSIRIYFSVFILLSTAFLLLLIYLLKKTKILGGTTLPVKSNLQTLVYIIEEFIKRYFQFSMALLPVCFLFALFLGYHDKEPMPHIDSFVKNHFSSFWKLAVFVGLYFIILATGVYYFTKWYLKKLYGNYLSQLKECIKELAEE